MKTQNLFRIAGAVVISLLLCAGAAFGQDSLNVTKVGQVTYWEDSNNVEVAGSYAYLTSGETGLRIIDISLPTEPREVGSCPTYHGSFCVAISGNFACVTGIDLYLVNIANPSVPFITDYCSISAPAYGIAASDSYAYVALYDSGLEVIDISDPYELDSVGFCNLPGNAFDVALSELNAYVADGITGLRIVDISDPRSPQEIGHCDTLGINVLKVAVSNSYAYVLDNSHLRIIDISSPTAPVLVGTLDLPYFAYSGERDIAILNSYAYIAYGPLGLAIVDISNPHDPQQVGGFYNEPAEVACGISLSWPYAYIADNNTGLRVVNVFNPSLPAQVGSCGIVTLARGIDVSGSYAYIASAHSGLRAIDISNINFPFEVGHYDTSLSDAWDVAVANSYAYLANGFYGLCILNISDPTFPRPVGNYDPPGYTDYTRAVAVSDSFVYLADGFAGGLRIVNISNPALPFQEGYWNTPGTSNDVAVSDSFAFIADVDSGLRIIDITDPSQPIEIASFPGYIGNVALSGAYAYVTAASDSGIYMEVINVTDPFNPVLMGSCPLPGLPWGITVVDSYVFVADGAYGLRVINASNPYSPFEVGYYCYYSVWMAIGVVASNSLAYVADRFYFSIYDCSAAPANPWEAPLAHPSSFALHPPVPNPFNPSTVLSYELRVPSQVSLKVYDTVGRLVATLVNEKQPAGTHGAIFNGSGLASGIYLAKLTTGEFTAVQKLVLLK